MTKNGNDEEQMRPYLPWSYALLAFTLGSFVVSGVILDSVLAPLSLTVQRWLVAVTLILPAAIGALLGILALRQPDRRTLPALLSILVNGLLALFFSALLAIAG